MCWFKHDYVIFQKEIIAEYSKFDLMLNDYFLEKGIKKNYYSGKKLKTIYECKSCGKIKRVIQKI